MQPGLNYSDVFLQGIKNALFKFDPLLCNLFGKKEKNTEIIINLEKLAKSS